MGIPDLISILGEHGNQVTDADEETFELFSHYNGASSLGMVDAETSTIDINVSGHDFTIDQSHGLLRSNREGGTTGAVLWKMTPAFASWIASPDNFLFRHSLLDSYSVVLELGAGISGIVGLCLAPQIKQYILTDQEYVLKLLKQNIEANKLRVSPSKGRRKKTSTKASHIVPGGSGNGGRLEVLALDWERTDARAVEQQLGTRPDVLVAADCIFNPAIVEPFVATLADLSWASDDKEWPLISIIAQQLRSPDVFTHWLETMLQRFHVWRLSEEALHVANVADDVRLMVQDGFVVHVCILRVDM